MNLTIDEPALPENPTNDDKWILSKYNDTVKAVTENLDRYELGTALANLYEFLWDYLCDWYIELVKPRLFESNPDPADRIDAQRTLTHVLSGTLQLLHPFMPFITEEIWQSLPHVGESIMISEWPKYDPALSFKKEQDDTDRVIALIRAIRNRRAEMNVPPSKKATVYIQTDYPDAFKGSEMSFMRLASADQVVIGQIEGDGVMVVTDSAKAMIPLDQLIDREKELARLNKEKEKIQKEINMAQGKLGNAGFVAKAPAELVEKEKEKLARFKEALVNLEESIAKLQ
jgi:valyl-tRNA synthetase